MYSYSIVLSFQMRATEAIVTQLASVAGELAATLFVGAEQFWRAV